MYLSVIVPVYNEGQVVKATLREVNQYLKNKNWASEVIVVNDGSTDNSLAEIYQASVVNLKIISLPVNLGKGEAVKQGMLAAQGENMLFMDADNSTAIKELDIFLPYLSENYDIIIGSRALKQSNVIVSQPWLKVCLGRLGAKITNWLAVPGIKDTQCGFKLFSKKCQRLFKKQTIKRWGFDFEILFLARKFNFRVLELPVTWKNDSTSQVKFWDYPRTFYELIKVKINNFRGVYEKN